MVNHFLPGLRCLHADMEQLSPEHEVRKCTQTNTHIFSLSGTNPKFPPCIRIDSISSAYLYTAAPDWLPVLYPGIVWLFTSFTNKPVHTDQPYLSASHSLTRCNSCEHFPKVTNDQLTRCSVYILPVCELLHTKIKIRNFLAKYETHMWDRPCLLWSTVEKCAYLMLKSFSEAELYFCYFLYHF